MLNVSKINVIFFFNATHVKHIGYERENCMANITFRSKDKTNKVESCV